MAVQMLRATTIKRVETRNHCCQASLSILVMISTPTNRVAITERAAINLNKKQDQALKGGGQSENRLPKVEVESLTIKDVENDKCGIWYI